MNYDLAIIGSGSGGFAAAISASRMDLSVLMIEESTVGGTCVNVGCIPSKALLAAAERRHLANTKLFPGITTSAEPPDIAALIDGKAEIVQHLQSEKYVALAADYGFEIKSGRASFIEGPALKVGDEVIEAKHYLIAAGVSPWIPPIEGLEETGYLTSTTAMEIDALPETLIVVGGNAIGLELGQMFSHLGVSVTIIEALPVIAPFEEPEISQALTEIFESEGIVILSGATMKHASMVGGKKQVTVTIANKQEKSLLADEILIATGRHPNTAGLGLERAGVKVGEKGEVLVDKHLQSTNPRIWAAGDITGHPQFVYVAGNHGNTVVRNAFENAKISVDYRFLPRVTFTTPAIASVGFTDEEATRQGYECECRVLSLAQVPRAIVSRETRGVAKIVADAKTNKVLGVHLLAEGAGDVILAAIYALEAGFTVEQIASAWCPYLTMGEAIKLTAQTFTTDVSKLSCCAV